MFFSVGRMKGSEFASSLYGYIMLHSRGIYKLPREHSTSLVIYDSSIEFEFDFF